VPGDSAVIGMRPSKRWANRHGFALRLVGCFALVFLAAASETLFNANRAGLDVIWLANGVLLSYLLLAPRWRWPSYLCAGAAGYFASGLFARGVWGIAGLQFGLVATAENLVEVLIGALLLRRRSAQLPRFTNRAYLIRFLAYAVVAGPAATGLFHAWFAFNQWHADPVMAFLRWAVVDGLGTAVVAPAFVAIFKAGFRSRGGRKRNWLYLALLGAVTVAAFSQTKMPLLLFLYPVLTLVLLALGLGWAALATLFIAITGGWFTIRGMGPLAVSSPLRTGSPSLQLQMLVASAMFMLYIVSIVMERRHAIERQLRKTVAQFNLVTENSRDVIILADFDGRRSYVSAAAGQMVGWSAQEVQRKHSTELVHPEDLRDVNAAVSGLRAGDEGAMIECRVMKKDGQYIWVEASLRVVRDPDTKLRSGILNIVRDITDRKAAEQKLREAYNAVEALSTLDSLTGLANRRRFDECLEKEWRRAIREGEPLSLLLVDVDHFKSYNDSFGHLRGDGCLKMVAKSALSSVTRPGDLVARYGGDEFTIILANTSNEGAVQVGNELCDGVRRCQLPHDANTAGIVTVSIGSATVVPQFGQDPTTLIDLADRALYCAKRAGRSRVFSSETNCDGDGLSDKALSPKIGI